MIISNPPKITLAEFSLRPLETSDIPAWYDFLKLPHVVEHTSWQLSSADDLKPAFEKYNSSAASSKIRFAIVQTAIQKLVGTVGYHSINTDHKTAEIAYELHPDWWGRGIATAACQAVTDWGLTVQGYLRVQATTMNSNKSSQKVLQHCGFEFEGILHNYRFVRGVPRDYLLFSRVPR